MSPSPMFVLLVLTGLGIISFYFAAKYSDNKMAYVTGMFFIILPLYSLWVWSEEMFTLLILITLGVAFNRVRKRSAERKGLAQ